MSDVGYLGCVQSWESGIPLCGFLEFKMREGSNVMEAGKWGAENERRSEGLGSWRSVVREWRLCCGVWVSEVGDSVFCCGKGMRRRGRDNAGRLGDRSIHLICNWLLWDPMSDIKVSAGIEKATEIFHPNNPLNKVIKNWGIFEWKVTKMEWRLMSDKKKKSNRAWIIVRCSGSQTRYKHNNWERIWHIWLFVQLCCLSVCVVPINH